MPEIADFGGGVTNFTGPSSNNPLANPGIDLPTITPEQLSGVQEALSPEKVEEAANPDTKGDLASVFLQIGAILNPRTGENALRHRIQSLNDQRNRLDEQAKKKNAVQTAFAMEYLRNPQLLAGLDQGAIGKLSASSEGLFGYPVDFNAISVIAEQEGLKKRESPAGKIEADRARMVAQGATAEELQRFDDASAQKSSGRGKLQKIPAGIDPETGVPMDEMVRVDPNGNIIERIPGSKTPRASVVAADAASLKTPSQRGKQRIELEERERNVVAFVDAANELERTVTQESIGIPGSLVAATESLLAQSLSFAGKTEPVMFKEGTSEVIDQPLSISRWQSKLRGVAARNAEVGAMVVNLAYAHALSRNQRVTDADFENSLIAVGGNTGSLTQMKAALRATARRERRNFQLEWSRANGGARYEGFDALDIESNEEEIRLKEQRIEELKEKARQRQEAQGVEPTSTAPVRSGATLTSGIRG